MTWEGLAPPYRTIVADPPWAYDEGWPKYHDRAGVKHDRTALPYSAMSLEDIAAMPVSDLANRGGGSSLLVDDQPLPARCLRHP